MRQPISVYARYGNLQARTLGNRVLRKLRNSATENVRKSGKRPVKPKVKPRPLLDLADYSSALDALAIGKNDSIIVHSGISHIGKLRGGPQQLYQHLRERIGPNGNLLFPAFPFSTLMQRYLATNPEFDSRTSPTKMGVLTDLALEDQDRLRSLHPTHSVVAFGSEAHHFVDSHHLDDTPFGTNSPFAKLSLAGGKILTIGVGLPSVTSFHVVEDILAENFPVRVYKNETYRLACTDDNGHEYIVSTKCHNPLLSTIRNCDLVKSDLARDGIQKIVPLGNHFLSAIDANRFDEKLVDLAINHRRTIYGRIWG